MHITTTTIWLRFEFLCIDMDMSKCNEQSSAETSNADRFNAHFDFYSVAFLCIFIRSKIIFWHWLVRWLKVSFKFFELRSKRPDFTSFIGWHAPHSTCTIHTYTVRTHTLRSLNSHKNPLKLNFGKRYEWNVVFILFTFIEPNPTFSIDGFCSIKWWSIFGLPHFVRLPTKRNCK